MLDDLLKAWYDDAQEGMERAKTAAALDEMPDHQLEAVHQTVAPEAAQAAAEGRELARKHHEEKLAARLTMGKVLGAARAPRLAKSKFRLPKVHAPKQSRSGYADVDHTAQKPWLA